MGFLETLKHLEVPPTNTPAGAGYVALQLVVIYVLLRYFLNILVSRVIVPVAAKRLVPDGTERAARVKALTGVTRTAGNGVLAVIVLLLGLEKFGVDTTSVRDSVFTPDGAGFAVLQLVGAYILLRYFLNNILGRVIVPIVTKEFAQDQHERAARVKTLAGVIRSTGNYVLTFIIVLMALKKFGVDTTPVLASASVIGLAVGFGSQKLVRDVTTGFLLLAENQFDVGDYITIGAVSGTVEEVGMRTTRIRDDAGKVYIYSNGDITMVCNHSMGLVSLFLDVPVPATEDLDKVRAAVDGVGERIDDEFGESLLERPHVDGLTAMTAAQVTVRIRYRAVATLQERIQMRLREEIRDEFARQEIKLV